MRRPLDYFLAAGLGIASFVLLYIRYWFPPGKIFDEVYFARAAEEYLKRQYIYEYTHPPLTKLLITLSTLLFGGLHGGDNSYGWRFLDVVFGALMVPLLYILSKRITGSTLFSAFAAGLLLLDGMHFVQSRIATPESFVGFFSLLTTYTFYRYWSADQPYHPQADERRHVAIAASAIVLGSIFAIARFGAETFAAKVLVATWAAAGIYLAYRIAAASRRFPTKHLWLALFAVSLSCIVTSKWYGVMAFGVVALVVAATKFSAKTRGIFNLNLLLPSLAFVLGSIYCAAYAPQFIGLSDTPGAPPRAYTLSEVVQEQYAMYEYHAHLNATHPYSSVWWQWPLDLRPVLYYADYGHDRKGNLTTAAMIYSLPNPVTLWLGLICVPCVGYFAIKDRNGGYALLVLTYLLQWIPWARSPRISFAYHFYVDIPITCLCVAITLQLFAKRSAAAGFGWAGRTALISTFLAVLAAFVYFYPELSATRIPYEAWHDKLWFDSWI